ncbi:MAG: energy transducer TonB [Ferruginibacter sp.]
MEKNKILNADILDIIFDGKNKLYGAYELRKTYNKRLAKATFFTIVLVLFAFLGTVYSGMGRKNSSVIDVIDISMSDIKKSDPLPLPPPPLIKPIPPLQPNQVKYTIPTIVKEDDVKDDEKIQDINDDQQISSKTVETENNTQVIQAPVEDNNSKVIEAPKANEEDIVFVRVENEAQFPGGQQAWARYLQKNLDPNTPVENGAPPGTYQVIVKFIVSKDGSISNVNAETKHGFGMEDEAIKIIQRGPKWTPALQNGKNVNAYRRQPVTFIVTDQ